MDETKNSLSKLGINELSDDYVSLKRFEDGGQYRFEVPGIQGPSALESLLNACDEYDLTIHRATQTKGIMFLLDDEISRMVDLADDANIQLFLAVGPRAPYDTSATVQTEEGKRIGYRLRGYKNLIYAIEDVKRAVDLGVRGILLYDEGLLFALSKMRENGEFVQLTEREIIEDEIALIDALDVPGQVYFFGHHQNNVARVSGHLKDKEKLIEGFRQKLHDFEINNSDILDISLSREYL